MTTVAIVQARMGSRRLPGKAMYPLGGTTVLGYLLDRLGACEELGELVVATTNLPEDVPLHHWAEAGGARRVLCEYPDDVLSRFLYAVEGLEDGDVVVRLTGDNPLVCPEVVDWCARWVASGDHDYYRTGETFPEGLDVEAFTVALLHRASEHAGLDRHMREHLADPLAAVAQRPGFYELPENWGRVRVTIDVPEDIPVVQGVVNALRDQEPRLRHVLRLVRMRPDLFLGNQHIARNDWQRSPQTDEETVG